ncbi:MAG: molecular chaperone Hsp33 [Kordiimonas sp.]|nr:molecular chaperone Hsp33 [Kordiimonas sp.]
MSTATPSPTAPVYSNHCLPFQVEGMNVKGRLVRLASTLDTILTQHQYPAIVNRLMGELLSLSALLGGMMKFDGIMTVQIKGDGPISFIVCDYATSGNGEGVLRCHAQFDEQALSDLNDDGDSLAALLGKGYMAITLDQGQHMDRYQGIVELQATSVTDTAVEYFKTSEQLPTLLKLSCAQDTDGRWIAGAMIVQHLAQSSDDEIESYLRHDDPREQWQRATALFESLTIDELIDPQLSLQDLAFRLYHEDGVRAFTPTGLVNGCRCSADKLRQVLSNFTATDLKEMANEDGVIIMTCHFCETDHQFELNKLIN